MAATEVDMVAGAMVMEGTALASGTRKVPEGVWAVATTARVAMVTAAVMVDIWEADTAPMVDTWAVVTALMEAIWAVDTALMAARTATSGALVSCRCTSPMTSRTTTLKS